MTELFKPATMTPYRIMTPYRVDTDSAINKSKIAEIYFGCCYNKKEEKPAMKVTYNGFTGELVKLEKYENDKAARRGGGPLYDLAIYDSEAKATHCFEDVKLENVKFMGGVMTFGG